MVTRTSRSRRWNRSARRPQPRRAKIMAHHFSRTQAEKKTFLRKIPVVTAAQHTASYWWKAVPGTTITAPLTQANAPAPFLIIAVAPSTKFVNPRLRSRRSEARTYVACGRLRVLSSTGPKGTHEISAGRSNCCPRRRSRPSCLYLRFTRRARLAAGVAGGDASRSARDRRQAARRSLRRRSARLRGAGQGGGKEGHRQPFSAGWNFGGLALRRYFARDDRGSGRGRLSCRRRIAGGAEDPLPADRLDPAKGAAGGAFRFRGADRPQRDRPLRRSPATKLTMLIREVAPLLLGAASAC